MSVATAVFAAAVIFTLVALATALVILAAREN